MQEEKRFLENISQKGLFSQGDKVLALYSGGPDSTFLLLMLKAASDAIGFQFAAFHMNHQIRSESADEMAFCAAFCEREGIPLFMETRDVPAEAARLHISLEEAGRQLRYGLAEEIRESHGFSVIATAHHADDNAETVLMRIIRGTGLRGLAGIPEKSGYLVRPLLGFAKREILDWLDVRDIAYVQDQSNESNAYFRNRVRNAILPMLEEENPKLRQSLLRLSEAAGSAHSYIRNAALAVPIESSGKAASAQAAALEGLPEALLYEALWEMARLAGAEKGFSFVHMQAAASAIWADSDKWSLDFPGMVLEKSYGLITARPHILDREATPYEYIFRPGSVQIVPKARLAVFSRVRDNSKKNEVYGTAKLIDYDKISGKILYFRSRKQGDVFTPLGLNHRKSIKKFFIDRKVPLVERPRVPLFLCEGEVFLAGSLEVGEHFKITEDTKRILEINIKTW